MGPVTGVNFPTPPPPPPSGDSRDPPRAQANFPHPKWSRNNFGKNDFFRPGDPGGPTVGPHRARVELPCGSTK